MAGARTAWDILEIAPTRDVAEIRRAYARRLKRTRPEDDPEGFQALLAAREQTLAEAREERPAARGPDVADRGMYASAFSDVAPDPSPERAAPPIDLDREVQSGGTGRPVITVGSAASESAGVHERSLIAETDDIAPDHTPVPRVVEIAPLEPHTHHWASAARLAVELPALDQGPGPSFQSWLEAVEALPSEPRHDVEATVLNALMRLWCEPTSDKVDVKALARTRPTVLQLGPLFGWPRETGVLRSALPSVAAAIAAQILRELLPHDPADPGVAVVRTGLWSWAVLQASDARVFLEGMPRTLAAFEAARRRESLPRRLDPLALVAPHIWAILHKRWIVALAAMAALWAASTAATPALDVGAVAERALACAALVLYAAPAFAVSILADRLQLAGAARAARRASRSGLYAPASRAARLRRAGKRLGVRGWAPLGLFASVLFVGPYFGLAVLVGRFFGR